MSCMRGAFLALPLVLAVSDLKLHQYHAARQHVGEPEEKTGKPSVINGEHLEPYNVPEELIGDIGLSGAKGDPGAKGICGSEGAMGPNVTSQGLLVLGEAPPTGVTRGMLLDLVGFNALSLGIMYWLLKKRIARADAPAKAAQEAGDDTYLSITFAVANVMYPPLEQGGHLGAFEGIVKDVLARAAVAGGAAGISAENVWPAMGEGDDDSTLVSANMSPPEGVTTEQLKQALDRGQLQVLLPPAVESAPGAESFKKGVVTVKDFDTAIEKQAADTEEAPAEAPDVEGAQHL